MRLVLGGLAAAALAVSAVSAPAASATHSPACAEEIQVVCDVLNLVDSVLCHPKFNPC